MEAWVFSKNADNSNTTSVERPTDVIVALQHLKLAIERGWWYIDRGYGWEQTAAVYEEACKRGIYGY